MLGQEYTVLQNTNSEHFGFAFQSIACGNYKRREIAILSFGPLVQSPLVISLQQSWWSENEQEFTVRKIVTNVNVSNGNVKVEHFRRTSNFKSFKRVRTPVDSALIYSMRCDEQGVPNRGIWIFRWTAHQLPLLVCLRSISSVASNNVRSVCSHVNATSRNQLPKKTIFLF